MDVLVCCQSPRGSISVVWVPSYLLRQTLKHQPILLSVIPFHLCLTAMEEASNTRSEKQ